MENELTKYQRNDPLSGGFAFLCTLLYLRCDRFAVRDDRRLHSHFDILELALVGHLLQ